VLLVLTLIAILIVQAVSDDEGTPTGSKPNAVPSAGTAPTPAGSKNAQNGAAQNSAAPSSAPPSSAAPSSAAPSSAAPTTAPAGGALPAGWRLAKVSAGGGAPAFTVPVPANARQSGGGREVRFEWNNRLLLVGRTTSPQPDAYDDWVSQEDNRRGGYDDYRRVKLDRVQWRGYKSVADWEYYYTTDRGNPQHVIRRNILVNDKAAYSLNWYVSTDDWDAAKTDLNAIYQGFQPK
jgi:hypothetical protein